MSSKNTVATEWLISIIHLVSAREATVARLQHLGFIIGRTPAISCELLAEGIDIDLRVLNVIDQAGDALRSPHQSDSLFHACFERLGTALHGSSVHRKGSPLSGLAFVR